jgi:hypothetical protein
MNSRFAELNRIIEKSADPSHKDISKAMAVLLAAISVGPNSERLVQETGYPESFIDCIVTRMEEAGLWRAGMVDDMEWWDDGEQLRGVGLFTHAKVALGHYKRQKTSYGALYVNASTGEPVGEWHYAVIKGGPGRRFH